jgi:hypothetical protein
MSMLMIIRDTAATFDLDKELQKVREQQLRAARAGKPMTQSQLDAAEAKVIDENKTRHYCVEIRQLYQPPEQARGITDQADYDGRMYIDAEAAIIDAHRRVAAMPYVGGRK